MPDVTESEDPQGPAESFLYIRCKRADKSAWVRAASGDKLSSWVTRKLNEAASPSETKPKRETPKSDP